MDFARVSNDEQNVGTHITPYSSDMNVDTIERKMLSDVKSTTFFSCRVGYTMSFVTACFCYFFSKYL